MPAVVSRFQQGPGRKRKAHAKSRKGCGNCKLRRVKCDETRPRCKKCLSYGVLCSYDGSKPALDLAAHGSFQVDLTQSAHVEKIVAFSTPPQMPPVSVNRIMAATVQDSLSAAAVGMDMSTAMPGSEPLHRVSFLSFTAADLEIVKRFQERTVMTIGTRKTASTYRDCICHLAFTHPFLMHMILSLTLLHDAYLASPQLEPNPRAANYQYASLQHWNIATKLFNQILSRPIPDSYRDAIWATGALLGAAVAAYVETTNAEEAWPLKPTDPNDLDWLKLSEGKKAIWHIAEPARYDSIFHSLAKDMSHFMFPQIARDTDLSLLPDQLKHLFGITPGSTIESNVYHLPLLILARLQHMTLNHDNVLNFLYFMGFMTPEFRVLLESKDPRALLLLLWWFRKLEVGEMWWLKRRAIVEGKAIEIWLEKGYGGEDGLIRLFGSMPQAHRESDGMGEVADSTAGVGDVSPSLTDWIRREGGNSWCPVQ